MRKALFILIISLCAACTPHNKPIANIQFSKTTSTEKIYEPLQEGGEPIKSRTHTIYFTSNIEILNLFKEENSSNPVVSPRLICALENDEDFSVKHRMKRYIYGYIDRDNIATSSSAGLFDYAIEFNFIEGNDSGSSESNIEKQKLNELLSKKQTVPCKVVMTIYLSAPYYSNTMYIPAEDLLREINK